VLTLEHGRVMGGSALVVLCPALERFKAEAVIIGRLLTGYTAIEYQLCMCAGMGGGAVTRAITELFSKRGETRRVRRADSLGGDALPGGSRE
jgi:hypothetical protein